MIEQLSFIIIQQHWSSSCFTFYSVWQKGQAVSLATRSGRFESSFLTLQGKPKHTHGNRVTHATVPFNSRFTKQAHRPQVQQHDDSVLAIS